MITKEYHLIINLELHSITCPGVWLCTNLGDVTLTIKYFNYIFNTSAKKARFPLIYHQNFIIDGILHIKNGEKTLETIIDNEIIEITLWQNSQRLAAYKGKLFLYNKNYLNNFLNIELIMKKYRFFPGIICPKILMTSLIKINYNNKNKLLHNDNMENFSILSRAQCCQELLNHVCEPYFFCNNINKRFKQRCHQQKPVCHKKYTATTTPNMSKFNWSDAEKSHQKNNLSEFFEQVSCKTLLNKKIPSIEASSPNYTTVLNNLIDYNLCNCLCHQNVIIGRLPYVEDQLDNSREYDNVSLINKSLCNTADVNNICNTKKTSICSIEQDNDVTVETQIPEINYHETFEHNTNICEICTKYRRIFNIN